MVEKLDTELIKKLRSISGAGVLECKKALEETKGDVEKALVILREKGVTHALKKTERCTKNGLISTYVHPGNRIGVLVEVNCETDFVARTDEFKNLVKEIGLQIAAANPQWIKKEDIPQEIIEKEKQIYRKQLQQESKPDNIIEKIIPGKLEKFFNEVCLLEQPYIRDPQCKQKVKDLITQTIAKTGENIVIKRFARFQLGEE